MEVVAMIINDLFETINRLEHYQEEREKEVLPGEAHDLSNEFKDIEILKVHIRRVLMQLIVSSNKSDIEDIDNP